MCGGFDEAVEKAERKKAEVTKKITIVLVAKK
jgi:hypothetical protein